MIKTPPRRDPFRDFFMVQPRYIYYDKNGEKEIIKNKNFSSFLIFVGR